MGNESKSAKAKRIVSEHAKVVDDGLDVLDAVAPDDVQPLSYARRLIVNRAVDWLESTSESGGDDEDALMLAVFVCSEKDVLKLHRLARNPKKLVEAAVLFADRTDPREYERISEFVQRKFDMLNVAETVGELNVDDAKMDDTPPNLQS